MWHDKTMIDRNKTGPGPWYPLALLLLVTLLAGCGEQRFEAQTAQDFTLPSLDGSGDISLGDYRGDVVYLTFWASWCEPCRQEMPYLAQLWQRHHAEGFQVIGINVDEDLAAAQQFAADHDLPFPLVRDADRVTSTAYRVPGFPTHYLVDKRGKIRFSGLGFNLNDVRAVAQEVNTLLQESVDAAD
jgi:peroxiredoxin